MFENIECEWPLFFTYLILDGLFTGNYELTEKYRDMLEPLLVDSNINEISSKSMSSDIECESFMSKSSLCRTPPMSPKYRNDIFYLVPELYYVPSELIEDEKREPNSQKRLPNDNVPLVWASSLHILGNLISENLLDVGEVDPLGRRFRSTNTIESDVVVQISILSEDQTLQAQLLSIGLETQTIDQISPITVCDPAALREIYRTLGMNNKLQLTGRPNRPVGTLATCRLYSVQGSMYAFTPHFMDKEHFYTTSDNDYLVSLFEQELQFVQNNWFYSGRPTIVFQLTKDMVGNELSNSNILNFMMKLRTGLCSGVKVRLGKINEMVNTSYINSLDFLINKNDIDWNSSLTNFKKPSAIDLANTGGKLKLTGKPRTKSFRKKSGFKSQMSALKTPVPKTEGFDYFTDTNAPKDDTDDDFKLLDHQDAEESSSLEELNIELGNAENFERALEILASSSNLYDQIDILYYISTCKGLDYYVAQMASKVEDLIEEVYLKSIKLKFWSIARQSAGILSKTTNWLTVSVTDLLLRQKQITIGSNTKTTQEHIIKTSMNVEELNKIINSSCSNDKREGPLVQELLSFLSSFIKADPSIFEGIIRLRMHNIIIAMREEIARLHSCDEDEALEYLMQMSPYKVKSILRTVFSGASLSSSNTFSLINDNISKSKKHLFNTQLPNQDIEVSICSAGFKDGKFSKIEINHTPINLNERGFNIVVIDPREHLILDMLTFDTHISNTESKKLADFLDSLKPGIAVIGSVKDDGSESLTEGAVNALSSLGCIKHKQLAYRDSYCFVAYKGATEGSVPELLKKQNEGPTDTLTHVIQTSLNLGEGDSLLLFLQGESKGRWLRRRKNDGALNRTPKKFYGKIFDILTNVKCIEASTSSMFREPLVNEKTPEEISFAVYVEEFLSVVSDPAEKQIFIECLIVVYRLLKYEQKILDFNSDTIINIDKIIEHALVQFWDLWVSQNQDTIKEAKKTLDATTSTNKSSTNETRPTSSTIEPQDALIAEKSDTKEEKVSTPENKGALIPETKISIENKPENREFYPKIIVENDFSYKGNEKFVRRLFYDLDNSASGTLKFLALGAVGVYGMEQVKSQLTENDIKGILEQ